MNDPKFPASFILLIYSQPAVSEPGVTGTPSYRLRGVRCNWFTNRQSGHCMMLFGIPVTRAIPKQPWRANKSMHNKVTNINTRTATPVGCALGLIPDSCVFDSLHSPEPVFFPSSTNVFYSRIFFIENEYQVDYDRIVFFSKQIRSWQAVISHLMSLVLPGLKKGGVGEGGVFIKRHEHSIEVDMCTVQVPFSFYFDYMNIARVFIVAFQYPSR